MTLLRPLILATVLLAPTAVPASPFTNFADDENACRQAGTRAIAGAAGPRAARRYDGAYNACMAAHIRARQGQPFMDGPPERPGNPTIGFPDAFYSVPYATPGYGYDGFSPP